MEAFVRTTFKMLFNPVSLASLLLVAGLICFYKRRDTRMSFVLLTSGVVSLLLMSTGLIPQTLLHYLEYQYPRVEAIDPSVHWVVVLGGGQYEQSTGPANHVLKQASQIRLIEGVRLYHQLPKARLLLSGGSQKARVVTEAEHMASMVSWLGIDAREVALEKRSKNTMDEANYIGHWVKKEPFYLVTSASHMRRAMALCQRQGLNPIAAPIDYQYQIEEHDWTKLFIPNATHLMQSTALLYETLGFWWARLLGKI